MHRISKEKFPERTKGRTIIWVTPDLVFYVVDKKEHVIVLIHVFNQVMFTFSVSHFYCVLFSRENGADCLRTSES